MRTRSPFLILWLALLSGGTIAAVRHPRATGSTAADTSEFPSQGGRLTPETDALERG